MTQKLLAANSLHDIYAPANPYPTDTNSITISLLLNPILNFVIVTIGVAAFATLIFAGFNFITSNGDKNKIEMATQMFTYAIIGLVLVAASFIIIRIISAIVGSGFNLI